MGPAPLASRVQLIEMTWPKRGLTLAPSGTVTVFVLPAVFIALAIVAVTALRRVVVPKASPIVRRMQIATPPHAEPSGPRVANGTPPSQVIPLALRDDRNLVATPAVVIGLQRIRRGNAARAASSGEIDADIPREPDYDDTLPPTIIVDES